MAMDILLDEDGDLLIENGDLVIGKADDQNVGLIFKAFKGEIRPAPALGFGAGKYLKTTDPLSRFKRNLKVELERGGYDRADIDVELKDGTLKVNVE